MDEAPEQKWIRALFSLYNALKYIAPSLGIGLAALKYQGKATGLFDENPVPAWSFLIATGLFFLIAGILKLMPPSLDGIWFHILVRPGLACRLISMVSAVSIFLPRQYSFVPLVMLTPLPVVLLAWPILHPAYNWAVDHAKSVFDNVSSKITYMADGSNFAQEASIPKATEIRNMAANRSLEEIKRENVDLEHMPIDEVFAHLQSSKQGLSSTKAEQRLHVFGPQ